MFAIRIICSKENFCQARQENFLFGYFCNSWLKLLVAGSPGRAERFLDSYAKSGKHYADINRNFKRQSLDDLLPLGYDELERMAAGYLGRERADRARFLDEKCGADAASRAEVEKLISQDEEASGLMSLPAIEKTAVHFLAEDFENGAPLIGQTICIPGLSAANLILCACVEILICRWFRRARLPPVRRLAK